MLNHCIYNILDNILPCGDKSKHDILRLEFLSACKIMENENYTLKILRHIPSSIFEILLQSVIYKSYTELVKIEKDSLLNFCSSCDIGMAFPDSLRLLILNWPYEEFVLRNQIPSLDPPIGRFPSQYVQLASEKHSICQVEDMTKVFNLFCNRLIQFITKAIFECTPTNTQGYSCKLRRLDVSGLGLFHSRDQMRCFSRPDDILEGINKSSIETFGHKIEILADAEFNFCAETAYNLREKKGFDLLRNIVESSLSHDVGISVYFKKITASFFNPNAKFPVDFYHVLALSKCKYLQLQGFDVNETLSRNLCIHLPELVGVSLPAIRSSIESWDFLDYFENLEQVGFKYNNGITNAIVNISKGLKYLDLSQCSLQWKDLESLAHSVHSDTLLQIDLSHNRIKNDSESLGLIILCQKMKNVKVLILDVCTLNLMSTSSVSKFVDALINCDHLEFLSMRQNVFSLEVTHMIIDGLAKNKSLRYLGLNLPSVISNKSWNDVFEEPNNENIEHMHILCKTFHEKLNTFRQSPVYISWYMIDN
ncbi:unnamed protein product [Meganyctiphanes norvegica]|uniref:Uncharacterized protein n=1 Tax=Meganyctiphanes norvegica TaxID=48144 RepID=A0AAV2SFH9_MEGNR